MNIYLMFYIKSLHIFKLSLSPSILDHAVKLWMVFGI